MDNYDYGNDPDYGGSSSPDKSIKGYQIIIVVLAVILGVLSFLYYNQMNTLKKEYAIERDTLTNRLSNIMLEYRDLQTENDTISRYLDVERERADSLMESLTRERNLSRAKIRQYEKELGTLRTVMQGYVQQIDSLNTVNKRLIAENVDYRQQVTSQRLRADMAEEMADELSTKIRRGAVIRVRGIALVALSSNDREVSRANRAARLRVDLTLTGNELSEPGSRAIYVRITGPDGYVMANSTGAMFEFEGEYRTYSAMREVDYQNEDLTVSIFYNGTGITSGVYSVEVYIDGYLSGSSEVVLR
ncbi:MAG: hypothetical protein LIO77_00580 [Rikenellaceae bacterium]|nr:hypothetical protein [Rikenellaceae bacterium]